MFRKYAPEDNLLFENQVEGFDSFLVIAHAFDAKLLPRLLAWARKEEHKNKEHGLVTALEEFRGMSFFLK